MHYQQPNPQGKLVRVVSRRGLRPRWSTCANPRRLSANGWASSFRPRTSACSGVPEGMAHGFLCLRTAPISSTNARASTSRRTSIACCERSGGRHRLAARRHRAAALGQGHRRKTAVGSGDLPVKVLITGAGGQLGHALQQCAPADAAVTALGHALLDIGDAAAVAHVVGEAAPVFSSMRLLYRGRQGRGRRSRRPSGSTHKAPAISPRPLMPQAPVSSMSRPISCSTARRARLIRPTPPTAPLGVYGMSKRDGEEAVLAAHPQALIVRTAWSMASPATISCAPCCA